MTLLGFSGMADHVAGRLYDQTGAFRITSQGVEARVNRHDVECTQSARGSAGETCTVAILGDVLTVQAAHPPLNDFTFSDCNVTYRSEDSRCWASTYAVTSPTDATIAQLGLSEREMQSMRREHSLANWSEDAWFNGVMVAAGFLTAVVAIIGYRLSGRGTHQQHDPSRPISLT